MYKLRPLAYLAIVGLLALGLAAAIAGCGKKSASTSSNIVAQVNGKPITNAELVTALKETDMNSGAPALSSLIEHQLLRQEAERKGIKVTEAEIKQRLDAMEDDALAATGKSVAQAIKESGQTEEEAREKISYRILQAKLMLTETDKRRFFEENKNLLQERFARNNEAVIYRHIVTATKPEAEALRAQLTAKDSKADFAKLAEAQSLDPMDRGRGGMVGWAVKGKLDPPNPALEKALFSMKVGEISEPLPFVQRVPQGVTATPPERWQIVKVEKHIPPHQMTMEDNIFAIEDALLGDRSFLPQRQQFVMNLQAKADIKIDDPVYKPLADWYRQIQKQQMRPAPMVPAPGVPGPARGRGPAGAGRTQQPAGPPAPPTKK